MIRLALINPNTNSTTTAAMLEIAEAAAPPDVTIQGITAPFGVPLITTPAALAHAREAMMSLIPTLRSQAWDGVIVAAFGDPGLADLRAGLDCPVSGIAEAGMAVGGAEGRAFAVVTTTQDLSAAISDLATRYGHGTCFRGVALTDGDPAFVMADPERLLAALDAACRRAIDQMGAQAIVIGGGPLAKAARALKPRFGIPVIEPIPEAIRRIMTQLDRGDLK